MKIILLQEYKILYKYNSGLPKTQFGFSVFCRRFLHPYKHQHSRYCQFYQHGLRYLFLYQSRHRIEICELQYILMHQSCGRHYSCLLFSESNEWDCGIDKELTDGWASFAYLLTVTPVVPGVLFSTSLKIEAWASSFDFEGNLFGATSFSAWQNCSKLIFWAPFDLEKYYTEEKTNFNSLDFGEDDINIGWSAFLTDDFAILA